MEGNIVDEALNKLGEMACRKRYTASENVYSFKPAGEDNLQMIVTLHAPHSSISKSDAKLNVKAFPEDGLEVLLGVPTDVRPDIQLVFDTTTGKVSAAQMLFPSKADRDASYPQSRLLPGMRVTCYVTLWNHNASIVTTVTTGHGFEYLNPVTKEGVGMSIPSWAVIATGYGFFGADLLTPAAFFSQLLDSTAGTAGPDRLSWIKIIYDEKADGLATPKTAILTPRDEQETVISLEGKQHEIYEHGGVLTHASLGDLLVHGGEMASVFEFKEQGTTIFLGDREKPDRILCVTAPPIMKGSLFTSLEGTWYLRGTVQMPGRILFLPKDQAHPEG